MHHNRLLAVLVIFLAGSTAFFTATGRINEPSPSCLEAVCKVSDGRNSGSGVVYRQDADRYYVLTAAHIVEAPDEPCSREIHLRFFHAGWSSPKMPARLEFASSAPDDIAALSVRKQEFAGYPPPSLLTLHAREMREDERVITIGVPRANDDVTTWPVSMLGRVVSVPNRRTIGFLPLIQPGHSGGALVTDDGKRLLGICTERSPQWVESRAISAARILELLPDGLK